MEPKPDASLGDQYDLEESVSGPASVEPTAHVDDAPSAPSRKVPTKDPVTGRFVKTDHSPHLAEMARDLGLSDSEIADTDSESLAGTVKHLNRQAAEIAKRQRQDEHAVESSLLERPKVEPEPTLDIDESQYDPAFLKAHKALLAPLLQKITGLESQVAGLTSHVQNQLNQTFTERCDRAFAKHEKLLGKGGFEDLKKDSPEFFRRGAVADLIREKMKGQPGSVEQKIDKAVEILFGSQAPATPETPDQAEQLKRWNDGALQRPTARTPTAEPKGMKKAQAVVAQWQKENAQVNGTPQTDEDSEYL